MVILAPYEPSDEVVALLEHGKYETRLRYVKVAIPPWEGVGSILSCTGGGVSYASP